jgi:hypothetical protein
MGLAGVPPEDIGISCLAQSLEYIHSAFEGLASCQIDHGPGNDKPTMPIKYVERVNHHNVSLGVIFTRTRREELRRGLEFEGSGAK